MKTKHPQNFLLFVFVLCSFLVNAQVKRYVKPAATGTGDGSSWANASGSIQSMITASASGDSVFVMKGTYTRTTGTFLIRMKEGVKVYGSFQGTESNLNQRVIENSAADSSRLNGNGSPTVGVATTSLTTASVLDGFFLTNAGARNINNTGTASLHFNAKFAYLIIANGSAADGAGIYNAYSSPTFDGVIFRNNKVTGNGGAIYHINGSTLTLNNVVFENNTSAANGGAIFGQAGAGSSNSILTNVIFRNNTALQGGAMYNNATSPTLNKVIVEGNTAGRGGGLYNYLGATPTLNDVKIMGNTATDATTGFGGGGMMNHSASPVLNRVLISGNSAASEGGGMSNRDNAHPTLNNVVISGNRSNRNGGGVYTNASNAGGNPTYTNATVAGNYAVVAGGGIYNGSSAAAFQSMVRNSIIYGNNAPSRPNVSNSSAITFINSLVQGSGGSSAWVSSFGTNGGNNIDADPKFVNPVPATPAGATTAGNYSLQDASSPANDAGSNSYAASFGATDISGSARIQNGIVNMGAYEAFNVVLPVSFGRVSATISGNILFVNWQTLKETNVDHFEIEASADGNAFRKIGSMPSKAKDSSSDTTLQYEHTVPLTSLGIMGLSVMLLCISTLYPRRKWLVLLVALAGITGLLYSCSRKDEALSSKNDGIYLRIKETDKDGSIKYSKTIKAIRL